MPVLTINLLRKSKHGGRRSHKPSQGVHHNPHKFHKKEDYQPTISDDTHGLPFKVRIAVENALPALAVEESYCSSNPDDWSEDQEHIYMVNGYEYLPDRVYAAYVHNVRRVSANIRAFSRHLDNRIADVYSAHGSAEGLHGAERAQEQTPTPNSGASRSEG